MLEKGKRWLFISQGMEGNEETSCSADVINEETSYSGSRQLQNKELVPVYVQ